MTHSAPFRYQPALDGLRCISVVVVLLFHHGVGWMSGGYLGVSVFFTLSGFLITSLFYVEHGATGRISPAAFYSRRVKRLVPASLACLTGVAVLTHTGLLSGSSRLRGDIIAAVAQVFNWHPSLNGAPMPSSSARRAPLPTSGPSRWRSSSTGCGHSS